jgi:hypothetical protein
MSVTKTEGEGALRIRRFSFVLIIYKKGYTRLYIGVVLTEQSLMNTNFLIFPEYI